MRQEDPEKLAQAQELLAELAQMRGGTLLPFHRQVANHEPLLRAFMSGYQICNKEGVTIPRKYRELILMALGCACGAQTTLLTHGKLAHEHGATVDEIGEVLRLVFLICGASGLIPAAALFEELGVD